MTERRGFSAALMICAALVCQGCFTGSEEGTSKSESAAATKSQKTDANSVASADAAAKSPPPQSEPSAKKTAVSGEETSTGVEPFQAPPLTELDAKAGWESEPVLDGLELMRKRQADEKPLCSVKEALALRNTSSENNAKITSALGRMPERDSDVDWDSAFVRIIQADVKSTNPIFASSVFEFDLSGLTGVGLFGFDWNFTPFALKSYVVSWQTSKDRMYDKVVLRDDLTWSDGHPLTAHDIVFSFRTILDPRVPVSAQKTGPDQLRWIEAYDDHTLVYFHKQAAATNVWNLNFTILPKHIYENYDDDPTLQTSPRFVKYENSPITGGRYIVKERRRNEEIVMERRENWYMQNGKQVRPKPYFKTIRLRIIPDANTALLALKNGDIESMELIPMSLWRSQTNGDDFYKYNTKAQGLEWTEFHFIWNCQTPFFSDKRVRKAMSYAFDYDEMLNTILGGLASQCVGPFHPTSWMAAKPAPAPYQQNLDKAEALLKEAGWEDHDGDGIRDKVIDGNSVKFDFDLLFSSSSQDGLNICTLMKENLDRIGVACNVKPLEFTVLQETNRTHKFQATLAGWGTGTDPDTNENIFSTQAAINGRNYGSYSNPEVDELFRQGKTEFDRTKRALVYGKIHRILWEDQPYTWLYHRNSNFAFSKRLRGYVFSPRGPFHYDPGVENIWKPVQ